MTNDFPTKPTRPGAFYDFQRQMLHALRRSRPGPSARTRTSYTTQGVFVEQLPADPIAGGGTAGMHFEGEYDASRSYTAQAVVVIRGGGPSAGSYVALIDVPAGNIPAYPDVGIYWYMLGRTSETTYWT